MSVKTYSLISTMKNEGPFILEWVAHYKALGFDHLVVCTNDCEDTTAEILKALQDQGHVRHRETRIWPRAGIQRSALKQSQRNIEIKKADWIFVCDADEFLNVKVGDGTVQALVEAVGPETDVIEIPWRVFGPAGVKSYEDRPITEQFLMAEAEDDTRPEARKFCKSIFTGLPRFRRVGLHRPIPRTEWEGKIKGAYPDGAPTSVDGKSQRAADFSCAQVNHYALRSLESYLVKRARGRANHATHTLGLDYWKRFNINQVEDTSIHRYAPAAAEWRARFLADPTLKALHDQSVNWHRSKISELTGDPDLQPLIEGMMAGLD